MRLNFLLPALLGMVSIFFEATPTFHIGEKSVFRNAQNYAAPQITTTIGDVADAYTRDASNAAVNFGSSTSLVVVTTTQADHMRASYLKFALGAVSGNVTSAVLRLYGRCTNTGVKTALSVYSINDDSWTDRGITWNNAPASSTTALSSTIVTDQNQYYSLDVTAFVQAQLGGDKTASFLIKQASNLNRFLQFNSRENSSNKPQLVLTVSSLANQAPVLSPIGNKSAVVGQLLSFTATASDADAGQALTFSLINAPGDAAINPSTGVFTWTPATTSSATFTVRVTDNSSPALSDDEQITVNVSPAPITTTFSNAQSAAIPNPGTISIPITVSGLPAQIDTASYGLQSVNLKLTHPTDGELSLQLKSPDGKVIYLFRKSPGININTTFDAVATKFIDNNEIAKYTGSFTSGYRPRQDLALLNNGQNPNGTWYLIVKDDTSASAAGTLTGVSLVFGPSPAKPLLTTSSLPIIKIYTANGADIVDDPKILADMYIINNGAGAINSTNQTAYQYQGKIAIEIRGNTSASHATIPKKQYGFESRDATGVNSVDVAFFGMPKQSDWILSAVMTDKSLLRNVLTYQVARDMGWWASRTQYCEVMINDEYRGVFTFSEKIKKDKNRVDIEKLTAADVAAPAVGGGYIFKIDDLDAGAVTWQTKIAPKFKPFQFVYPKPEDVAPAQKTYLQSYVDSFEAALHGDNFVDANGNGFRKFSDDKSFIDFFLVSEMSKNNDAYRASTYFYKKRAGKLVAGPVWDFDRAYGNQTGCTMEQDTGYVYRDMELCHPGLIPWWWARLLEETKWKQDMICRYNTLRQTTLSQAHLYHIIDSAAAVLNGGGQQRNFIRWNIWGKYVESIPKPYATSYAMEVNTMKQWISGRLAWLDNAFGTCPGTITKAINANKPALEETGVGTLYPSPFKNHLSVSLHVSQPQNATIRLVDINGKLAYQKTTSLLKGNQLLQVDLGDKQLASGLYLLQVNGATLRFAKKVFKE